MSCCCAGEGNQEGTELALCVGAKSSGARGMERGERPGAKRADVGSGRHVGEGSARVNCLWCEEMCDTSLKGFRCGHRTMVKEKVFCARGLDPGQFVSYLTVGSDQKVLGSSVSCYGFSVEDR